MWMHLSSSHIIKRHDAACSCSAGAAVSRIPEIAPMRPAVETISFFPSALDAKFIKIAKAFSDHMLLVEPEGAVKKERRQFIMPAARREAIFAGCVERLYKA
ncbi:hypothetical protein MUK42_33310 [Musa troglodytarum]|uniref:Uncharacterized protein n=1 Tax=Musa troglodytarum TaxID=320322 RepID=A0A9E7GAJ2_9LILI|nr:hypothetical protein MUK42_33310 [Musa troglodytarum]